MRNLKQLLILFALSIITFSCSNDDTPTFLGEFQDGYFIVNEGPFQSGTGTITFVDKDGKPTQNIYKATNNEDLGNIVQSMTIYGDNAYIIVNNSNKIVVVNRYTFKKVAIIEGNDVNNPRYLQVVNGKGYVTNWGDATKADDDFVAVLDLTANTISSTIAVGEGPESMVANGNSLYVALKGGYGRNNQVVVIDTSNDSIATSIEVAQTPNSLVNDNGTIWVLSSGVPSWAGTEEGGVLSKIESNAVTSTYEFETTEHPSALVDGGNGSLYYKLGGKIYAMNTTGTFNPTTNSAFDGSYYGMTINNGKLYVTDAKDYASEGDLKIFDLSSGNLDATITAGIIPNGVVLQ